MYIPLHPAISVLLIASVCVPLVQDSRLENWLPPLFLNHHEQKQPYLGPHAYLFVDKNMT